MNVLRNAALALLACASALTLNACSTPTPAQTTAPAVTVTVTAPPTRAAPTTTIAPEDCPYVGDDNCDGQYEAGEVGPCPDEYGPDCEQDTADDVKPTPTETTTSEQRQKLFITFARSTNDAVIKRASDKQLIAWGHEVCANLDNGDNTVSATYRLYLDHNIEADGASILANSAIPTFCPEHMHDN